MGKISAEVMWDYLKESIVILQTTPYTKYLIKKNKQSEFEINMNFFNLIDTEDAKINLKNLYNISKILCHDSVNNVYAMIGYNFKSLSDLFPNNFFKRAFNIYKNVVFSIKNILQNKDFIASK